MKTVNFRDFQKADTGSKNGDCAKALQAALEYIKVQGEPCTLCFPPNEDIHIYKDFCKVRTYHTSNTDSLEYPEKTIGILLEEQKDLIFAGNGCRFVFHGDLMAIAVVRCENIVLRDFSWDFENPTASQLTVKQVNACSAVFEAAEGCDFEMEKGKVKWIFSQSPYTGKPYQVQYNEHEACLVVGLDPESGMQRRYSLAETPFSRAIHIKRLSERKIKISYFGKTPKPWRKTGMVAQMVASKHRQTAGAFLWERKMSRWILSVPTISTVWAGLRRCVMTYRLKIVILYREKEDDTAQALQTIYMFPVQQERLKLRIANSNMRMMIRSTCMVLLHVWRK